MLSNHVLLIFAWLVSTVNYGLTSDQPCPVSDGGELTSGACPVAGLEQADQPPGAERVLVMVKPDGLQRGLLGQIVSRFERKGFKLVAIKMIHPDRSVLEQHYEEHAGKSFYESLLDYMTSGPVVPMVWEGNNVIKISRTMLGATDPLKSLPGTIRGDFGVSKQMNLLHVSDSVESAEREVKLWFQHQQILSWTDATHAWKL